MVYRGYRPPLIEQLWPADSRVRQAIDADDVVTLGTLIDDGYNLEARVLVGGRTALFWAIIGGHVAAAVCLIHRGARLHVPGTPRGHHSALYHAVVHGLIDLVHLLLQPGVGNGGGAAAGNAVDINAGNYYRQRPLHAAALYDDVDAAVALLETPHHRCDPNLLDVDGDSPLHIAAHDGYLHVVRVLLAHGAALDVRNNLGYTASEAAAHQEHHDVYRAIESERRRRRRLHRYRRMWVYLEA